MKKLSTLATRAFVTVLALAPASVQAALINPSDKPVDVPGGNAANIRTLIIRILNYALSFVGLIAVAFVIYAGFLYLTAGVNADNTKKAKQIIVDAIIGIIIILISWVIVNTVIVQVSGAIESGQTQFAG